MTLEEIENSLPSGFHDAGLRGINIDYVKGEAVLDLRLDIGDPDADDPVRREGERTGKVTISGLIYCAIETPDPRCLKQEPGELKRIDSGPMGSGKHLSPELIEALPPDAYTHWIFVDEWNAFIHIAAMDASFEWTGEPRYYG
jgi:hypothetical protein